MSTTINIHAAKTQFSRLLQRAARGEEIIIARNGKPVAKLTGLKTKSGTVLNDDPLLNLDKYGFEGPGGLSPIGRSIGLSMGREILVDSSGLYPLADHRHTSRKRGSGLFVNC
jgi:prevent-host-death family protein